MTTHLHGNKRRLPSVLSAMVLRATPGLAVLLAPLLPLTPASAVVLDPPVLHCASVDVNGDVTLTWSPPADPNNDFASYEVFHATASAGPFVSLGTIGIYAQTTFLHVGAGAGTGPRYYYLTTTSSSAPPNTSVPGDTLSTMYLQVGQSAPLGSAVLNWTALHQPTLPGSASQVDIWLEYPQGTWSVLDQAAVTSSFYDHVISICEDSLTYRIGLTDAAGCTSFSNVAGDVFADATPPSAPVMQWVSVDTASGLSTLHWSASPEGDTDAYIIVLNTPGGNVILDTVYGQFTTTYQWPGSMPGIGAESFTIAAFDTCWTGVPPSPNTSATLPPHTTIHATTTYDRCNEEITLFWTPYVGWPVQYYEVFFRVTGGPWTQLGAFPDYVNTTTRSGVTPFTTYEFVVQAWRDGGPDSTLSNKALRPTDYPSVPQFNYLRTVTVDGPNSILVLDSVDLSAEVMRYRLERSQNGDPFEAVASLPGGGGPLIQFVDNDVNTAATSYQYRVLVDDSCGNEVLMSNLGNSIRLQAGADLRGFNRLQWNGYAGWAGLVSGYAVYRSVAGGPFALLTVNGPSQWSLDDDVNAFDDTNGSFCYYVEALEAGNPSGVNAISVSNEACAVQQAQLWVPNAFIAGGFNDSFVPVTAYTDLQSYEFTIFNRWGQEIWTTSVPGDPWKGQVNGNYVPQGVYGWYCRFRNGEGRQFEERGTVTFIWGLE